MSSDCHGDVFNKNNGNLSPHSQVPDVDDRPHSYPKPFGSSNRSQGLVYNRSSDDLPVFSGGDQKSKKCLFRCQPDLSATINTDFTKLPASTFSKLKRNNSVVECSSAEGGFDFGQFQVYYDEHQQLLQEERDDFTQKQVHKGSGEISPIVSQSPNQIGTIGLPKTESDHLNSPSSSVWCIDCKDSLIVAGCADGKIEVVALK